VNLDDAVRVVVLIAIVPALIVLVDAARDNAQEWDPGNAYNCSNFNSCQELLPYWVRCWRGDPSRLDRDRDGVPCESICGHYDQNTGVWEHP
jgi:hypothetical protein